MKKYVSLFLLIFVNSLFCQSQKPCIYFQGDTLFFSQNEVQLKSKPSTDGHIITTIKTKNYNFSQFSLEVVDEKLVNNFIKIKFSIEDTSGAKEYLIFDDTICWVNKKFVDYPSDLYPEGSGTSIEDYTYWINEMNILRIQNTCRYIPDNLSLCYQQRGIAYFNNADYSSAIFDFTKSIEVSPSFKRII